MSLHECRPAGELYVVGELRHDSRVTHAPSRGCFEGPEERADHAAELNGVLARRESGALRRHFRSTASQLRSRITQAPAHHSRPVSAEFARAGFFEVAVDGPGAAEKVESALRACRAVWHAWVSPRPVPSGLPAGHSRGSRNFQPAQGYLYSAPVGIGAAAVWERDGGNGRGITICDIEAGWNRSHENLPRGIPLFGGRLNPDPKWRDHGTAVLGLLVAQPGARGMAGICHGARAAVQSFLVGSTPDGPANGYHNLAAAIVNATDRLSPGDVIQLEVEAPGADGVDVPMQSWPDVASAVRAAVDRGISVVAAAGNGGADLDGRAYAGTGAQRDYGAVVVGAGCPPSNYFGTDLALPKVGRERFPSARPLARIGVPRSRLFMSNFGSIVNVQGWGWDVASLGYGDAQGGSENRWYTLRFAGTSSATAVVGGAVACIQGRAKVVLGAPLSPRELRTLMVRTGSPQQSDSNAPLSQHVGPLPDLEKAMNALEAMA